MRRPLRSIVIALMVSSALSACSKIEGVHFFDSANYPQKLSEWGILQMQGNHLVLADGVRIYDINTPLFTDHAQKLRTLYLPPGTHAEYSSDASFEFPTGTIVSKTFFYPESSTAGVVQTNYEWSREPLFLDTDNLRIVETRLLVKQENGWDALPYVWKGDDAYLKIAGALERMQLKKVDNQIVDLPYIVPTRNECAACHATDHSSGNLKPIGLKARHLNRSYLGIGPNQLLKMQASGRLQGLPALKAVPRNAAWQEDDLSPGDRLSPSDSQTLTARARAYLDINCGHCHNPAGAADTSGLMLDSATVSTRALGICKPPIAAGQGTGGRLYSIVPGQPDASILLFRMVSIDPGSRMPELGRSLAHARGIELIDEWITSLSGECIERSGD